MWLYVVPVLFLLVIAIVSLSGIGSIIPLLGSTDIAILIVFLYGYKKEGVKGGVMAVVLTLILVGVMVVILMVIGVSFADQGFVPSTIEQLAGNATLMPSQ